MCHNIDESGGDVTYCERVYTPIGNFVRCWYFWATKHCAHPKHGITSVCINAVGAVTPICIALSSRLLELLHERTKQLPGLDIQNTQSKLLHEIRISHSANNFFLKTLLLQRQAFSGRGRLLFCTYLLVPPSNLKIEMMSRIACVWVSSNNLAHVTWPAEEFRHLLSKHQTFVSGGKFWCFGCTCRPCFGL